MRELCGNYENNFDFLTNCTSRNVQFRFFAIFELSTFWTIKINKTLFINAKYWIYITPNSTRISEFLVFDIFDLGNFPLFPINYSTDFHRISLSTGYLDQKARTPSSRDIGATTIPVTQLLIKIREEDIKTRNAHSRWQSAFSTLRKEWCQSHVGLSFNGPTTIHLIAYKSTPSEIFFPKHTKKLKVILKVDFPQVCTINLIGIGRGRGSWSKTRF